MPTRISRLTDLRQDCSLHDQAPLYHQTLPVVTCERQPHLGTLIRKYSKNLPRYTSYPPVPSWTGALDDGAWFTALGAHAKANPKEGIALYVHLPFCEQLCTYCACNKRITVNHSVEAPYLNALKREWERYLEVLPPSFLLSELHLGGGTPTFFSAENLDALMQMLLAKAKFESGASLSVEVHPNHTSREQLEVLYAHGFRRISIGVQSLDLKVQVAINRVQPMSNVNKVAQTAREIGYTSINFDAIYGLPHQGLATVDNDVEAIVASRPDRIAYYGYAHVPWIHPGQRRYTEADLPSAEVRFASAQLARQCFIDAGYLEIGFDHYALPSDTLARAASSGALHRNFMGYTDRSNSVLIGLGASSISETPLGYMQNEKHVEAYRNRLDNDESLFIARHPFTEQERATKQHIKNLMCQLETSIEGEWTSAMLDLADDGLVHLSGQRVQVKPHARPFLRSVCAALDPLEDLRASTVTYSSNL